MDLPTNGNDNRHVVPDPPSLAMDPPRHIANIELAQGQLDQTYLEEQTTEYQTKERIAEKRAKRLIATEKK
jgi:hypothetical protein